MSKSGQAAYAVLAFFKKGESFVQLLLLPISK